jgi:hypothetical protein
MIYCLFRMSIEDNEVEERVELGEAEPRGAVVEEGVVAGKAEPHGAVVEERVVVVGEAAPPCLPLGLPWRPWLRQPRNMIVVDCFS